MTKPEFIPRPKGPFVLFSMGLDGYEGEYKMWNAPEEEIGVYHILVRIKHEMELLKERTGRDFYVFGTHMKVLGPIKKLIEKYGRKPIDVLFAVNLKDLAGLEKIKVPRSKDLKVSSRGWRRMVNVDSGQSKRIPEEIHTWGGNPNLPFYGLRIAELQYFSPKQQRFLRGKHLFYCLNDSPLTTWIHFTMGILHVDPKGEIQNREGSPHTRDCQADIPLRL